MANSQKLIVLLLIIAIVFSVVSIIVSMSANDVEVVEAEASTGIQVVSNAGNGVGLGVEEGGAG